MNGIVGNWRRDAASTRRRDTYATARWRWRPSGGYEGDQTGRIINELGLLTAAKEGEPLPKCLEFRLFSMLWDAAMRLIHLAARTTMPSALAESMTAMAPGVAATVLAASSSESTLLGAEPPPVIYKRRQ